MLSRQTSSEQIHSVQSDIHASCLRVVDQAEADRVLPVTPKQDTRYYYRIVKYLQDNFRRSLPFGALFVRVEEVTVEESRSTSRVN